MKSLLAPRSIAHRTLTMLTLLGGMFLALAFVIFRFSVYDSFVNLEEQIVAEDAQRVRLTLHAELSQLRELALEWSSWDDTYEHVAVGNAVYARNYLLTGTLLSSSIDAMALFGLDGETIWAEVVDGKGVPADAAPLIRALSPARAPFQAGQPGEVTGLLSTSQGGFLVVALPVLRTDNSGPPVGWLMMGRRLSSGFVSALADRIGVPFQVRIDTEAAGLDEVWELLAAEPAETTHVRTLPSTVVSYQLERDLRGNPAVLVEAMTPRRVTAIGAATAGTALAMLMVAALVFLAWFWWFVNRSVILPIRALEEHVAGMRTRNDLERRFDMQRNDEIGSLASAFNGLTARLRRSIDESEEARSTALAALRARSDFLARMSHEIRTPMNGVVGMTSILLDGSGLHDDQRQALETIQDSGQALLVLIDDILDLAKIEAGRQELVAEAVDVRRLIGDCVALLQPIAGKRGLKLLTKVDQALLPQYLVDGGRLRQVLTNLTGNALKFTDVGQVVVAVVSRQDGLRFSVTDTGIGIPTERLEMIFDSFSQDTSDHNRRFGGTGLGLTISRQLVELMGGSMGVDSTPGVGSTFWFELPLAPADSQPVADIGSAIDAPTQRPPPGLRVLVADDNLVNRQVVIRMLERLACEVTAVVNGEEAVCVAGGSAVDLVLMDCEMPKVDGYEAARLIRRGEAIRNLPRTPIIALTANVLIEQQQRCLSAGMDEVLAKPITLQRLAECLVRYAGESGQEQTGRQAR